MSYMTSQTKKFIEMRDIIGLRLQCTHTECQATLLLPLSKAIDVNRLIVCPHCQRPWIRTNGDTMEPLIATCMDKLKTLANELKNYKGLSLMLEIKSDEAERAIPLPLSAL
jgi:hypothetical protein